jgi:hypothetical protein
MSNDNPIQGINQMLPMKPQGAAAIKNRLMPYALGDDIHYFIVKLIGRFLNFTLMQILPHTKLRRGLSPFVTYFYLL